MRFKHMILLLLILSLLTSIIYADNVGRTFVRYPDGLTPAPDSAKDFAVKGWRLEGFFNHKIENGELVLSIVQKDPQPGRRHLRYDQYYQGIPIFGGQVIYHLQNDIVESINGEYWDIPEIDTNPELTYQEAVDIYRSFIKKPDSTAVSAENGLTIYPSGEGKFRLAYQITLAKEDYYSTTGLVDARSGDILFQYSNIHFDEGTIGLGVNVHNRKVKLAATYSEGTYYLYDEKRIRPYNHYTADYRSVTIPGDADNYWDRDGSAVSAHANIGLVYDFYYSFFNRNGIDNHNLDTIVFVHNNKYKDNAFWNGQSLNFCVPGSQKARNEAALDVVCHEYTHAVTSYTSNLYYAFESGALNESLSDIIGTTAEFYWHPQGNGLYKADWYIGEDAYPSYKRAGCRNLANPNANSQLGDSRYPDPCHLSQKYEVNYSFDNGGVHLNMTIYSHAFYLLANGGRNRVSGKSVSGIGLDKAADIFYRAWVNRLTQHSDFLDAANALLNVAYERYGGNSNEYKQTIRAMEAIGWIVN